jgi:sugar/nucleoside kinase (ribokinase family)
VAARGRSSLVRKPGRKSGATIRKEKAKINKDPVTPRDLTLDLPLPAAHSKPFDVAGVGENSLDFVAVIEDWPVPDSKAPLREFAIRSGGQVATALVACARLGWRARYVGAFGDDEWGRQVQGALATEGVEVTSFSRVGVRNRVAVALIDDRGRRAILEHRDPRLDLAEGEVAGHVFQSARILLADATDVPAATRAARAARAAGVPVILDVERPADGLDDLLSSADVIIAPGGFVSAYTGAASLGDGLAALEARFSPALLIATLGPEGSVARCRRVEIETPAAAVEVVDTTGAGDAFRGGFAAGWLHMGAGAQVAALLEFASAVAALSCRAVGAQTSLPTRAEVHRLLGM